MYPTRISLLTNLKENNDLAWQEFIVIYKPMIYNWLKSYALQPADIEDLTQEIMLSVYENKASFEHNGRIGAFRLWLRLVTLNVGRNYLRKVKPGLQENLPDFSLMLEQLEDPQSNQSLLFNKAHDRAVVHVLLDNLSAHFQQETLAIFKCHVMEEWTAPETAAKMNVSVASVHVAKSRVLRRLRQDAEGWLDDLNFI